VSKANSSRSIFTPAVFALALAGGVVAGGAGFATGARAETGAAANVEAGRELFNNWSCSACHTLADAGSAGVVGPSLDNPDLTRDVIVSRITNGQGAMPSFGGQITDEEIATLADYIVAVNHSAR